MILLDPPPHRFNRGLGVRRFRHDLVMKIRTVKGSGKEDSASSICIYRLINMGEVGQMDPPEPSQMGASRSIFSRSGIVFVLNVAVSTPLSILYRIKSIATHDS